ncbi:DoxX family membrane protein [Rhodococcus spelaei]|uniref:DoxX family membrane protein n=1 Tax=Rhodococcus spelaei TaxID=2546320 RepID=A0A541BLT8_9NOCA|nr:MauE/DoxX family redox-associated membrane protein [Rhodococcus spelaei]TQF73259.1 DoxX family membrane protein [Rhodococcus spelaei]
MLIRVVSLLARLGLAAVWLISGWIKFADPTQTVVAVRAYQLLPEDLVRPVASALPMLEIALGLLLVVGLGVRLTAIVSVLALATLIAAVASAWARGLSIDCGCFGGGGAADVDGWDYAREIARDVGFMALAVWLIVFPRSPLALGPRSRPQVSVPAQQEVAE